MATTETKSANRLALGHRAAHRDPTLDEIMESESVKVRQPSRREQRSEWGNQFADYQTAMDTCGAHDHLRILD